MGKIDLAHSGEDISTTMLALTLLAVALSAPTFKYTPVYPINSCEFFQPTSSTLASSTQTRIGGCAGTQFGCCGFPIDGASQQFPGSCASQNCTACERAVSCFEGSSQSVLNATETVLEYVQSICRGVVGPSAKQCITVTAFGIKAIDYVERGLNATAVYKAMGYCGSPVATRVLGATTRTG